MSELPFEQWFWDDWFADPAVTALTPTGRCVWFELLGRMHQYQTSRLCITRGTCARYTRMRESDMLKGINDIIAKNAGEITIDGEEITIICRRDSKLERRKPTHAERQKRYRERQKRDAGVTSRVTQNVTQNVTPGVTKSDISLARDIYNINNNNENPLPLPESTGKPVLIIEGAVPYPTDPQVVMKQAETIGYLMSTPQAENFIAHYSGLHWKVNGQQIMDWRQLLVKWKHRQTHEQRQEALDERAGRQPATQSDEYITLPDGSKVRKGVV